jgi:hypothetical protein
MPENYLNPTQESGASLMKRKISGEVFMLNLLRLKEIADYSASPEMAPQYPITGREAFQKYIDFTLPFLKSSGGDLIFLGSGGNFFIGPIDERWDIVMLIKQKSVPDFFAFASNQDYLVGLNHRTAAIEDSRLLPIVESKNGIL